MDSFHELLFIASATLNGASKDFLTVLVTKLNHWVILICQLLAMFVICVGIAKALLIYIKDALLGGKAFDAIRESRLEFGHALSLGLGFLIGSSILKTTLAPTWDDIGKLAAIIAIRTILNFFLTRDIGKHSPIDEDSPAKGSEIYFDTQETEKSQEG